MPMICDKIIYRGQTVLTLFHIGLDKDVSKRKIEKTEKLGRYNLSFTETVVEDEEIENIKDWITKEEGLISPGESINPYGDGACAKIIHYRYLNKPSSIFKLVDNSFRLKITVEEYLAICEFANKYVGIDIKTNPMICGDVFVCKCYQRNYSCSKENSIVLENIPADSTVIVRFKKGKLLVSSKKTEIEESQEKLEIQPNCLWDSHDIEIYHNKELVYYQNDICYVRHIFLNTKIYEPGKRVKLQKIGTEYIIEKDSNGRETHIGEKINEYDQILTDSFSAINKQIKEENPDDKVFFIKPGELDKATELIGKILEVAKDEIWIFDSYFSDKNGISSNLDWLRIIAYCPANKKNIVFYCSAPDKALNTTELINEIKKDSVLNEMLRIKGHIGIHFYQAKSPIHDRFVLYTDGNSYGGINIGTSFNSLERNHYCISKLSHSAAKIILYELTDWLNDGMLLANEEV